MKIRRKADVSPVPPTTRLTKAWLMDEICERLPIADTFDAMNLADAILSAQEAEPECKCREIHLPPGPTRSVDNYYVDRRDCVMHGPFASVNEAECPTNHTCMDNYDEDGEMTTILWSDDAIDYEYCPDCGTNLRALAVPLREERE
jgi:hypothetical protein